MEFEEKNFPINKIDGVMENGKQFDIEIVLPEDNRNVIYGVINIIDSVVVPRNKNIIVIEHKES